MPGPQLQVSISESPAFEEVDAEIVVVAGCALGFVSSTCPPHVLHIEAESPLEIAGIGQDDILYKVTFKLLCFFSYTNTLV